VLGAVALWLVVTYWIGPAVIRAAYEGRSVDLINRIIQGHGPIRYGPMRSVVLGHLDYIQNGNGTEELYDLFEDPREEHDLAGLPVWADSLEKLRSILRAPQN